MFDITKLTEEVLTLTYNFEKVLSLFYTEPDKYVTIESMDFEFADDDGTFSFLHIRGRFGADNNSSEDYELTIDYGVTKSISVEFICGIFYQILCEKI